jgi:hypothetical protein
MADVKKFANWELLPDDVSIHSLKHAQHHPHYLRLTRRPYVVAAATPA